MTKAPATRTWLIVSGILLALFCTYCILLPLSPYIAVYVANLLNQQKISRWVEVVDQDGTPVSGYKLEIWEMRAPLTLFGEPRWNRIAGESDSKGLYQFRSSGPILEANIDHMATQNIMNRGYLFHERVEILSNRVLIAPREPVSAEYEGSQGQPGMVRVLKVGPPCKLLYSKLQLTLRSDTTWWCVDVLSGKMWESESPDGDFNMTVLPIDMSKYPHLHNARDPRCKQEWADWSKEQDGRFPFYARSGAGLFPVCDYWGVLAPSDGYCETLHWPLDWSTRHANTNFSQFYYKLHCKGYAYPLFGRAVYHSRTSEDKKQIVEMECFTNMTGSRSLYYEGYVTDSNTSCYGPIKEWITPNDIQQH